MTASARQTPPLSARMTASLVVIGVLSFLGILYFTIFGARDPGAGTARASAFSTSAIGHKAFIETLRRLDMRVLVSRYDTLGRAGENALVLMIEPDAPALAALLAAPRGNHRILLVLPKRGGEPDSDRPEWIARARLLPTAPAERALRSLDAELAIERPGRALPWSRNDLGVVPALDAPQLIASRKIEPLIANPDGILLGTVPFAAGRLWILSDPDLLANHGLGDGENAALAAAIVALGLPPDGTAIVDETSHGFEQAPNLLPRLLEPPFVAVTLLAALTLGAGLWCGAVRFGRPRPEAPALKAGKLTLIDNAAGLLRQGVRPGVILQRFARVAAQEAGARLHAPKGLSEASLLAWLDLSGKGRAAGLSIADLVAEADALAAGRTEDAARRRKLLLDLALWKEEILDGSGERAQARR